MSVDMAAGRDSAFDVVRERQPVEAWSGENLAKICLQYAIRDFEILKPRKRKKNLLSEQQLLWNPETI